MERIQSVISKQLQGQISWLLLGFTFPKCKIRMNPIIVKFETEDSEIFFYLQANKLTCQFYSYTHTHTLTYTHTHTHTLTDGTDKGLMEAEGNSMLEHERNKVSPCN